MSRKTLSVAICTLPVRLQHLQRLLTNLEQQIDKFNLQGRVEVLYLGDTKTLTVGAKRNKLAQIATGDYITFVDDDDTLNSIYLIELIKAIDRYPNIDVVNFNVEISINGAEGKPVLYSKEHIQDKNLKHAYLRIPNHLMCFKRKLVLSTPYLDISFEEDAKWAKAVLPKITNEVNIDRILYFYNCNHATSETLPDELRKKLLANV